MAGRCSWDLGLRRRLVIGAGTFYDRRKAECVGLARWIFLTAVIFSLKDEPFKVISERFQSERFEEIIAILGSVKVNVLGN